MAPAVQLVKLTAGDHISPLLQGSEYAPPNYQTSTAHNVPGHYLFSTVHIRHGQHERDGVEVR
ncbi:MAG TPA: hypothetical protein VKA78_10995 [Pyrinomonadaceae bacterium]|nr:hypothetical protein [Pyrinomonadaceae bacterium]